MFLIDDQPVCILYINIRPNVSNEFVVHQSFFFFLIDQICFRESLLFNITLQSYTTVIFLNVLKYQHENMFRCNKKIVKKYATFSYYFS